MRSSRGETAAGGRATVIEATVVPRTASDIGADRTVHGPVLVGVVDGSTTKPWQGAGELDGADVADVVVGVLSSQAPPATARILVDRLTEAVAQRCGELDPEAASRPCATFTVLDPRSRQVWRVGDQTILVNGTAHPPQRSLEALVAAARVQVIRGLLAQGVSQTDLRADDAARSEVLPLLKGVAAARNQPGAGGFGAIDGTFVPDELVEVILLPTGDVDVVMATDGYVEVAPSLAASEQLLAERLGRDPLMVEDPPATKGVALGAASFDDRALVRVHLAASPR